MKFEIVELKDLSGKKASIYSGILNDENETLFDKFLLENKSKYVFEVDSLFNTIDQIANFHGARRQYFKENEGKIGNLVCALYDSPDSNLRLYCIRFGKNVIILGGCRFKTELIRALQENPKLKNENYLIREISELIYKKMKNKEIFWESELELGGNLIIETDE